MHHIGLRLVLITNKDKFVNKKNQDFDVIGAILLFLLFIGPSQSSVLQALSSMAILKLTSWIY